MYSCRLSLTTYLCLPPLRSLLHTPFLFTGQQVLSGCVYSPCLPPTLPSHWGSLSLSLSFYVCLSHSLAAGRRREEAITAAQEGGWKKKSTQRKQLQSPTGCQLQSPQPLAFFNQANTGKTVAVERHQGPHSISPTWWSQPQRAEFTVPEGLSTERSSSLHEKYPLKSTYYHLIILSLKNMSLLNGNCAGGTYICWGKTQNSRHHQGAFFLSLSKSELYVCRFHKQHQNTWDQLSGFVWPWQG